MKPGTDGRYHLSGGQSLQFVHRSDSGVLTAGTTNEEVISVLLHRLREQNKKLPCRENSIALTKLEEGLMWLEKRSARSASERVAAAVATAVTPAA